jgi:hypothetical protein
MTIDMASYATKADLDERTRAILNGVEAVRQELKADIATMATKQELQAVQQALSTELAQHTRVILEAMQTQIRAVDEKYADLPARVTRLESRTRRRPG